MGYAGRLRAAGPLIADQFRAARRVGFDEVELPDAVAERASRRRSGGVRPQGSYQDRPDRPDAPSRCRRRARRRCAVLRRIGRGGGVHACASRSRCAARGGARRRWRSRPERRRRRWSRSARAVRALPRRLRGGDLCRALRRGFAERPADHLAGAADALELRATTTSSRPRCRAETRRVLDAHATSSRRSGSRQRFGQQDETEVWAALFFRYHGFPWDDVLVDHRRRLSTGLNYATDISEVEAGPGQGRRGQPADALLLAGDHLRAAEPSGLELLFRFHHRSGVFGLVSDAWGGAQYGRSACACASDAWLAAGGGARLWAGAAAAAKSPQPCQNGKPDVPPAPARRRRHGGDRRSPRTSWCSSWSATG